MSKYVCDCNGCNRISEFKYVFTNTEHLYGDTSPAYYCEQHADNYADPSDVHTGRTPINHE